jgi:hypothetical protein
MRTPEFLDLRYSYCNRGLQPQGEENLVVARWRCNKRAKDGLCCAVAVLYHVQVNVVKSLSKDNIEKYAPLIRALSKHSHAIEREHSHVECCRSCKQVLVQQHVNMLKSVLFSKQNMRS